MSENNNQPLLSEKDREAILSMYGEMKTKYAALDAAVLAGKPAGEIKAGIDKITSDIVAMQEKYEALGRRADVIEERILRGRSLDEAPKSLGQMVIEDPGFIAAAKAGGRIGYTVQLKTMLRELGRKTITGVSRGVPDVLPGIALGARLPIGVRSLVPQGTTTAGAVGYVEETSFTNNAAPVLEGAAKPASDKVFTPRTLPVEVIAHYFKVSRQTMNDLPAVAAAIENNGIYGVKTAEDNQLLNGNGTAPQLKGFNGVPPAAPAPAAGPPQPTIIDAIGMAYFDLATKGFLPDGAVVNPADWGHVVMTKNSLGNYLFANP